MEQSCKALALRLQGLVVFRGLLEEPLISRMLELLEAKAYKQYTRNIVSAWAALPRRCLR